MNYIGLKVDIRYHLKHRAREECKSLGVVIIAVNSVALKIILIIQKIIDNAIVLSLKNSAILPAPCHGHGYARDKRHGIFKLLLNAVIERHNNAAPYKTFPESLRQTACHIRPRPPEPETGVPRSLHIILSYKIASIKNL